LLAAGAIGAVVGGFNHVMHDVMEKTQVEQQTEYSENQILTNENGTIETQVNVEYRYTLDKNGKKIINLNSVKVNTTINDWLSPIARIYNPCPQSRSNNKKLQR
jgi:hypothetical protein